MIYTSTPIRLNKITDGKSQYLHIKYSDDGETFTANNGEELGAYIGTLVDFNPEDSTVFSDYTWKKFTEDVDQELEDIRQTIIEQYTTVMNDSERIMLEALKRYVETSNFEEYKETVSTQLSIMADGILMNFNTTTEQINKVDGDLQSKYSEIKEYIRFSGGSITLGASNSVITLTIDNDRIVFKRNGVEFGSWDGDNFSTGNIIIRLGERFQYGSFADIPRPDGSVITVWVGD